MNPAGIAADLFRTEGSRIIAALTARFGTHRLQLAEDVVQEALVRALQTWPYRGVPANPAAWLTQTARNLALDQLRREQNWNNKQPSIAAESDRWLASPATPETDESIADDTLRMMFVCFHPQLSTESQTALALRTLCGLSAAEIAAAFLSRESAIEKRLVRARQRIRELGLPFEVPGPAELPARLDAVLRTLYLLFNEGYKASSGDRLVREDLCHEAMRLTSLLVDHPHTAAPRVHALLALIMLNAARLPARSNDSGILLRLHEQNRNAWDAELIRSGIHHLGLAASGESLSIYHLEAGIAACHSTAADDASTDWPRILSFYDRLVAINASPVAAMNRAVAVARVHGPQAGLDALDAILDRSSLESYHLYHAIRGTLAAEMGKLAEALTHFRQAGNLANLPAERDFIARRIAEFSR
ncbi:MAG: sigma-70 family RNA polymerase sigma factor [Verrucomicrobiota bacterium]